MSLQKCTCVPTLSVSHLPSADRASRSLLTSCNWFANTQSAEAFCIISVLIYTLPPYLCHLRPPALSYFGG